MPRPLNENDKGVEEFLKNGYVKSHLYPGVKYKLQNRGIFYKKFKYVRGRNRGSIKFSSNNFFGEAFTYFYNPDKQYKIINHLLKQFYTENSEPSEGIKKALNRVFTVHCLIPKNQCVFDEKWSKK